MMRGLRFFRRTSDPRTLNLASYHDPRSLTWSWVVSWRSYAPGERRHWLWLDLDPPGTQDAVLHLRVGRLCLSTQPKMFQRRSA